MTAHYLPLSTEDLQTLLRLRWYLHHGYSRREAMSRIRNADRFDSVRWYVERCDLDQLIKGLEEVKTRGRRSSV